MEEKKRGKQVAQLGEQEVQSIPPLIVSSDKAAVSTNIAAQPESETSFAYLELAYSYVPGQPLVTDPASLTTQLWKLHNWYMAVSKKRSSISWQELRKSTSSENMLYRLSSPNFSRCTINAPTTNQSSAAIVCK